MTVVADTRTGWTGELWSAIAPAYESILVHPFIAGLTTGELDSAAFVRFLAQDTFYVNEYAKSLAALSATAPDMALTRSLIEHAGGAVTAETTLHAELVEMLGLPHDVISDAHPTPTAAAYVDFVTARVHTSSFFEGLAAVLPCMWVYAEVGRYLAERGSPHPVYSRWIESYASSEYLDEVAKVLEDVDHLAPSVSDSERTGGIAIAQAATRYEWMFWDSAYRGEDWPTLG